MDAKTIDIIAIFLSFVVGSGSVFLAVWFGFKMGRRTYIPPEKDIAPPKKKRVVSSTHDTGRDPFTDAMREKGEKTMPTIKGE